MDRQNIIEELAKRYIYLHENKEIILAMCIGKDNALDYSKGAKKDFYIYKDVSPEIVEAFGQFILSDDEIEQTALYNHTEAMKECNSYLGVTNELISKVEERREKNPYLKDKETFTVWKILGYIRRENENNKAVLAALDKYYNLDRFIQTNTNWVSGYYLEMEDACKNAELLNEMISPVLRTGSFTSNTKKQFLNQFEEEDNYREFDNRTKDDLDKLYSKSYTAFSRNLRNLEPLTIEEKFQIASKLHEIEDYKKRELI